MIRGKFHSPLGAVYKGRPPKSRIFKPPPSPCPGVSEFPKPPPLPGRPRPDFSIFTHFSIFTLFYFCSLRQSLLPNSCFYKVLNAEYNYI